MTQLPQATRWIAVLLAMALISVSLALPAAQASMIDTATLAEAQSATEARERIHSLLERDDVRDQLVGLGVDPAMAEERVAALSDAEARQMAARMEELPAGSSSVIGAAVLIFLVLLLTDILGFTDVFPFVTSTAR
ncbi:PA2779 family protein [Sediminicurvatus halobius]|uniref:PA2779 family protein n=1 Tax=Sediminicurvatus halobius TaxID=2182432 RepID=A0A2U2N7E3_9GAMM|nr:PA2779 family protein [Spiribacter halobius]PWG65095.1 hypothetical protein DEM34_02100 [Spiribacter halobius]UEX78957.1 PA2779 family protein [Spiribacter halobius]